MSPYEHFFWNFAIFYRKPWAWKVGVGGLFPDLIYVVLFIPRIFSYQSFSDWMQDPLWDIVWDSLFVKSVHSLAVWSLFFFLCLIIFRKDIFRQVYPFLFGWGLHIAFDAFTHVSDGYALFFPLSGYRFPAPLSYWEKQFYAEEYFWISHFLMTGLFLLWIGARLKRFLYKEGLNGQPPLRRDRESASDHEMRAGHHGAPREEPGRKNTIPPSGTDSSEWPGKSFK